MGSKGVGDGRTEFDEAFSGEAVREEAGVKSVDFDASPRVAVPG